MPPTRRPDEDAVAVLDRRTKRQEVDHDALSARVDALAKAVEQIGTAVTKLVARARDEAEPIPSWYTQTSPADAADLLADLEKWLNRVYIRWPDARLPDCWRRHDWVVEELLVLWQAYKTAWAPGTPPTSREEWLRRYRPGTVEMIGKELKQCSLLKHEYPNLADFQPRRLEGLDDGAEIAAWWVSSAGMSADPAPTSAALGEAKARRDAALSR